MDASPGASPRRPGEQLRTDRLVLRRWRDDDLEPFAALNSDPLVMEHFPAPLDRRASDALAARADASIESQGFGFWAVGIPGEAPFIGFVGLNRVGFEAHFTPAVEVGWRLARAYWGRGLATEAARRALAYGFDELGLAEIVAFTIPANLRSMAVMSRLGMTRDPADDFDHPDPAVRPVGRFVLYRATKYLA